MIHSMDCIVRRYRSWQDIIWAMTITVSDEIDIQKIGTHDAVAAAAAAAADDDDDENDENDHDPLQTAFSA
jgi:hypothetical protein